MGDGTQRRDFTHVKDVVNINISAMNTSNEKCFGEVFNVGTGSNHSVLEVAKMVDHPYTFIPPREGEAETTLADINKAQKLLNYEPSVNLKQWISTKQ